MNRTPYWPSCIYNDSYGKKTNSDNTLEIYSVRFLLDNFKGSGHHFRWCRNTVLNDTLDVNKVLRGVISTLVFGQP